MLVTASDSIIVTKRCMASLSAPRTRALSGAASCASSSGATY
jgi:hypothetical protein